MASMASSSLMQKLTWSSRLESTSPDQMTAFSSGKGEKFWNHSGPFTGRR